MLNRDTLNFYRELRNNNHKEWFDRNRKWYEVVKKDTLRFTGELLARIQAFDPGLGHLQPKDCLFRINRDIRFSADKTPYKTHIGIFMTPGGRKLDFAGYYVHIDEESGSFAGGGCYMPQSDALKKIRREISGFYEDLEEILKNKGFKATFGELDQEKGVVLKRPPKGFDADHSAIEYLKFKSFTATRELEPQLLTDPKGLDAVVKIMKDLKPLNDFLNRALKTVE
ncbi:MAG: DUF2461 domain-containing protein [Bacteroidales bacterium]|nr:DUF2461 domain-containing protein [Bacteroidales bacterium]